MSAARDREEEEEEAPAVPAQQTAKKSGGKAGQAEEGQLRQGHAGDGTGWAGVLEGSAHRDWT